MKPVLFDLKTQADFCSRSMWDFIIFPTFFRTIFTGVSGQPKVDISQFTSLETLLKTAGRKKFSYQSVDRCYWNSKVPTCTAQCFASGSLQKKVWGPIADVFESFPPKMPVAGSCWHADARTHKTLFVQKSNFPSFLEYILNLVKIGNLGSPDETAEARSHVLVRWITFQVCWKQVKNNANYFTSSDSPPWHCWVEVCQVRVCPLRIWWGKNGEFENIDFRFPWP